MKHQGILCISKGLIRPHNASFLLLLRWIDATVVFLVLSLLCGLFGVEFARDYKVAGTIAALLLVICMEFVDVYRPWRGARLYAEARAIFLAWSIVAIVLLALSWSLKTTFLYSRLTIGWWLIAAPMAIIAVHLIIRFFLRLLRRRGRNSRTAVVVGAGDLAIKISERIADSTWTGIRLYGFFDDDARKKGKIICGAEVWGPLKDVASYVQQHSIDYVYIALPMRSEKQMLEVFDSLQDTTASVFMVPDVFVFEMLHARLQDIAGIPVISLCETPLTGPFGLLKKLEDMVLATIILIIIAPLMAIIAVGVKITSPGPIIFKQRRYGLNGEQIKVYKFRTMSICEDGDCICQAKKGDSRVTPFGAFLRRTSFDELPQFINVLQGRMSVVGPRPHALSHNEEYRKLIKGYMLRHKVKPGITGLAQVNGWRGETDTLNKMEKRVEFDMNYIRDWSILLDLKIVYKTIFVVFIGRNAY